MDQNLKDADEALGLSPQEADLYKTHLMNLYGSGGVDNEDGSRSSLYQATVQGPDDRWYNIPTVWGGKKEVEPYTKADGTKMDAPNQTALDNVRAMGWDRFPSYNSPAEADARYEEMHKFMEKDTGDYFAQKAAAQGSRFAPMPAGGSNYLENQRARFGEEMKSNPATRSRLRAILSLENEGAGPGVVESVMNRMAMTGGTLEEGMGRGRTSFYGPERKGLVEPRMRTIEGNPTWRARLDRSIDQALGGSNVIKGHTDQGSAGDPNYHTGGIGVNINGERFNHWGGHKGVEYSRQWTENQQREVERSGGTLSGDSRREALDREEENIRTNPQMSPEWDFARKGITIPTGDLSSAAKPSENIQRRGPEPNFVEKLQDAIRAQFKGDMSPEGELSDKLGVQDVVTKVHEAVLRTYGRNRLRSIESEKRWAEWLKDMPKGAE